MCQHTLVLDSANSTAILWLCTDNTISVCTVVGSVNWECSVQYIPGGRRKTPTRD